MGTKRVIQGGAAAFAFALVVGGCSQPLSTREKSTLVGGGLGAGAGAIIGAAVGSPGAGAAIGGALGAGTGALLGDQMQKRDVQQSEQQQQIDNVKSLSNSSVSRKETTTSTKSLKECRL
jgi:uncharacterized protein YcfJ